MSKAIFMLFFGFLLAVCGVNIIDKPIQTIAILMCVVIALNFDKIKD